MTHALASRALALAGAAAVLMGCAAQATSARPATLTATIDTAGPPSGGRAPKAAGLTGHRPGPGQARVIVRQVAAGDPRPAELVERLGGRVTQRLPIVDGFAATLPATAVPALGTAPGVAEVVHDRRVLVAGSAGEPAGGPRRRDDAGTAPAGHAAASARQRVRTPAKTPAKAPARAAAKTTAKPNATGAAGRSRAAANCPPATAASQAPRARRPACARPRRPAARRPSPRHPAAPGRGPARRRPLAGPVAAARQAIDRSVYRDIVGAARLNARGTTGAGVTVALIDTGVAPVGDLSGRLVRVREGLRLLGNGATCKNLSGEPGCDDSYGHGTFIAGLIAGDGRASGGRFRGVAPGARLLSVKIAGHDGSSDVSTLLAAIQWVVSHRAAYGIKVLNLSLGTDGDQSYHVDPLNYAVQRAWKAGIVVVTAASNRGPGPRTIAKPGDDPYVITVGAIDDRGTAELSDDAVPDFTARGPTAADGLAKPDLVAPGAAVVSLNAPGSYVDRHFPAGTYRRGTGTSMATAIVSGVAALVRAAHPDASPDRVKYMLTSTAAPVRGADRLTVGAGVVDGWRAATAAPPGLANRGLRVVGGALGGLDGSRGMLRTRVVGPLGLSLLSGSRTATLAPWEPASTLGPWTERTWRETVWQLRAILPTRWSGTNWTGRNWQWHGASAADGRRKTGTYGRPLPGSVWYGVWG